MIDEEHMTKPRSETNQNDEKLDRHISSTFGGDTIQNENKPIGEKKEENLRVFSIL